MILDTPKRAQVAKALCEKFHSLALEIFFACHCTHSRSVTFMSYVHASAETKSTRCKFRNCRHKLCYLRYRNTTSLEEWCRRANNYYVVVNVCGLNRIFEEVTVEFVLLAVFFFFEV